MVRSEGPRDGAQPLAARAVEAAGAGSRDCDPAGRDDARQRLLQQVVLRDALGEDALCLSVLAMQVFLDTYAVAGIRPLIAREALSLSQGSFEQFIGNRQTRTLVAEHDGHLIGFAQLRLDTGHALVAGGRQAELLRLYVQRPFTGSGLGAHLLRRAESIAGRCGAAVVWLTAWAHNHRALRFYDRLGYRDQGLAWYTFEHESHENRVLSRPLAAGASKGGAA